VSRLRNRLILIFIAATLIPLGASLWVVHSLLDRSLRYSATLELDQVSRRLEQTARQFYLRERQTLKAEAQHGIAGEAEHWALRDFRRWPAEVRQFWDRNEHESFQLGGRSGDTLYYFVRREGEAARYSRSLGGIQMESIRREYAQSQALLEDLKSRDLRRGFFYAFVVLAAVPWTAALVILIFSVHRISAVATAAYNRMAEELQQSRERLLFLTRLESWQSLARKTAHEVKNSLTPIRLMMEELAARHHEEKDSFERQAAQVIVDEVNSLERRVRAFSQFAAEPPVHLRPLNAAELLEERIAFLRAAHPQVRYRFERPPQPVAVLADEDLLKAVLTNLLENAAQAAGPGGEILALANAGVIEVHDSGPGLNRQALETVFEPTISFKKGGMGLGLSIARKSAVLCGGDIVLVKGELGGAGFRVLLSPAA
jgi:signal transduction histidine kinase